MAKLVILDKDIKKLAENALGIGIKSIKRTKDGFELKMDIEDIERTKEDSVRFIPMPYAAPCKRIEPFKPYWNETTETTGGYYRIGWESIKNK